MKSGGANEAAASTGGGKERGWIHKAPKSRVIPRGQRDKGKDEGSVTD